MRLGKAGKGLRSVGLFLFPSIRGAWDGQAVCWKEGGSVMDHMALVAKVQDYWIGFLGVPVLKIRDKVI